VILVGDCTDPFSMETVRATMGSLFAVPLVKTTPADFLRWKKDSGARLVATHLAGAVDYRTIDYRSKPVVLMMGNEQSGLPDDLAAAADALARIPQVGRADSLNLAVATGVMLFEVRRHLLTLDGPK
ncbi:MAG: RNA methyltransferase, partial [Rhizobium sp.]|nr:RNA methyltransferase [Rhizobium sp.]